MKKGKSIVELAEEIQRQAESKKDYVADTRAMAMVVPEDRIADDPAQTRLFGERQEESGQPQPVVLQWGNGNKTLMPVRPTAHQQMASRFNVPRKFYDRLLNEHPDLLAHTMTNLMHREPQKRMLRTLDGHVRAFLSDRFRPLDNDDLFEAIFPVLSKMGVHVVSTEVTERRMYIKFLYPDVKENAPDLMPACYAGRENNVARGGEFAGYDIADIIAGGVITNSEVGRGTLSIKDLLYECWCDNGCVKEAVVKQTHVGRSSGIEGLDASEFYRDETRLLDDAAFYSKVTDTLGAMFRPERFQEHIAGMRRAKGDVIEEAAAIPQVVEVVGKRLGHSETTRSSVLDAVIRDGDLSRYGIHNAITLVAQKVECYDEASAMEEDGAKVLEMGKKDWGSILAEAKRLAA